MSYFYKPPNDCLTGSSTYPKQISHHNRQKNKSAQTAPHPKTDNTHMLALKSPSLLHDSERRCFDTILGYDYSCKSLEYVWTHTGPCYDLVIRDQTHENEHVSAITTVCIRAVFKQALRVPPSIWVQLYTLALNPRNTPWSSTWTKKRGNPSMCSSSTLQTHVWKTASNKHDHTVNKHRWMWFLLYMGSGVANDRNKRNITGSWV